MVIGEMVTVDDQWGDFIVNEVHQERKTAGLMIVTSHPVKPKEVLSSILAAPRTNTEDAHQLFNSRLCDVLSSQARRPVNEVQLK